MDNRALECSFECSQEEAFFTCSECGFEYMLVDMRTIKLGIYPPVDVPICVNCKELYEADK